MYFSEYVYCKCAISCINVTLCVSACSLFENLNKSDSECLGPYINDNL